MLADQAAVNGSCTHFVRKVSLTSAVFDPNAVADALCERALKTKPYDQRYHSRYLIGKQKIFGIKNIYN